MNNALVSSERSPLRRRWTLAALGLLAGAACGPAADATGAQTEGAAIAAEAVADRAAATPVIFDTDMDFDDTAALAHLARLHKAGQIDLRLVSVNSAGSGLPGRAVRNARCLLERFGLSDIPVADSRTEAPNPFPDLLRYTMESVLSDLTAGCTASEDPSAVPAAQAILDTLDHSARPVTLIATGPLTNVAAAVQLRASRHGRPLASQVSRAYVMGGALGVPAGLCCGLENTFDGTQTFNLWADPAAAETVLEHFSQAQVSLVGENATASVPVRPEYVTRLGENASTPEAAYVYALVTHPIIAYSIAAGQQVFWWDPATELAATDRGVVQFAMKHVRIVQSGPSTGATVETAPSEPGAWTRFAVSADASRFEDEFLAGLDAPVADEHPGRH